MKTVLMTGGTGVFGDYLVRRFIENDDVRLVLIVRAKSDAEARARVESQGGIPAHSEVFAGDLLLPQLGLTESLYADLQKRVTHVLHAAASIRFNSSLEEARRNNVETSERAIEFAEGCDRLARFGFMSTALVAGKRTGLIREDQFVHDAGFNNTYQQSKYESEALIRNTRLPFVVFRPPLIYTPRTDSAANLTNFLVVLVSLIVSGRLPYVLGTEDSPIDIVDGHEAANIIIELFLKENLSHDTYHITNCDPRLTSGIFHHIMEREKSSVIPLVFCGDGDKGLQVLHEKLKDAPDLKPIYQRTESFLAEPAFPKMFDNAHLVDELHIERLKPEPAKLLQAIVHDVVWSSSK